jgi:predicted GNAT family acetyltransferase
MIGFSLVNYSSVSISDLQQERTSDKLAEIHPFVKLGSGQSKSLTGISGQWRAHMIYTCTEADRTALLEYCSADRPMNLFIIGDIDLYGFSSSIQTIYADKDDASSICSVYLAHRTNLVINSKKKSIDNEFIKTIVEKHGITDINGDYEVIKQIKLEGFTTKKTTIASLTNMRHLCNYDEVPLLEKTDLEEFEIDASVVFGRPGHIDTMKSDYDKGCSHFYGCKAEGKLVSGAMTAAESKSVAMIVSVFTLEAYRGRHYALKTVSRLCADMLAQDKLVCLFFDNPNAAQMYHKIGFVDYGAYGMMRKDS